MPLPDGPPLMKARLRHRRFRALMKHPDPELRPIRFPELEYVFYDKDLRKIHRLACRVCLRFQRCIQGPQQQFRCFAYWLWSEASTQPDRLQKLHALKELPLSPDALASLSPEELLGLFVIHRGNLGTVVDFSRQGLRQRLVQIGQESQENSRYLLTTD